ncbi:nucleoside recognition domain-containing protein [Methanococcoides methylutens]|uniref:Putative cobalt transporter in sulfate-reducing delta-proteobacteria n=1 Tax=Methanococcoides methylutens MM1 TaxID=1434104 RepID=A0A0E3X011_METMT|nr:nucleoside recognition domain-containing protein [Methanococcoides methylutens]AKB85199.1 putative cobalt transporter in sulfate-reducing delta-proteobacteria [Methanococcoides methylutens MM1]
MWIDGLYAAFDYLIKVIPPIVIGTLIMDIMVEMGWVNKLGFIASPLMRFGHLREEIGLSFLTSFGSSAAGNSMIAKLHDDDHIDRKETIIATMVNSFPSGIVLSRDLFPVVVILLGTTGLIYLGIVVLIGFLKTLLALLAARILLTPRPSGNIHATTEKITIKEASIKALKRSKRSLTRIVVTMTIVSVIVFQLMETGVFDWAASIMKDSFMVQYVPADALPIIAGWFASNIAAYTIAGNLLEAEMLSSKDIILALLIGRILASVARIRTMLPYYIGIFSPNLGVRIMFVSLAMQNGIMLGIAGFIIVFF